jgi:hypothetical protein
MNHFIKAANLARRHDFLSIDFPNCTKRMALVRYERSSLRRFTPFAQFDEFLETCCAEIEAGGTQILLCNVGEFHPVQIIAPNILLSLTRLHVLLENIPSLSQFRDELVARPLAGSALFTAEQTLAKLDGNEEAREIMKQLRRIHHLFLALDYRRAVSYSHAVSAMYFRTSVARLSNKDYLAEQPLVIPFEPDLLITIDREIEQQSVRIATGSPRKTSTFIPPSFSEKFDDCELPEPFRKRKGSIASSNPGEQ